MRVSGSARASQHVKCILVDGVTASITAANFTESAHERNIELGALFRENPKVVPGGSGRWDSVGSDVLGVEPGRSGDYLGRVHLDAFGAVRIGFTQRPQAEWRVQARKVLPLWPGWIARTSPLASIAGTSQ